VDRFELTARAQDRHFWYRGFHLFLAAALDAVATAGGAARILECGCGTGAQMGVLARYGQVFGFDLSPVALGWARRAGRPLVRADIARIPFPGATFDLVASFDVIQYAPDAAAALAEMTRVVKPGGAIVVSMVALEALRGDHSEEWGDLRRYEPEAVRRLAAGAGLEVVRLSFLFFTLAPILLALRAWQRRRRRHGAPRSDAEIRVPSAPVNALMTGLLRVEAAVARWWDPPVGSTLLLVARKPVGSAPQAP